MSSFPKKLLLTFVLAFLFVAADLVFTGGSSHKPIVSRPTHVPTQVPVQVPAPPVVPRLTNQHQRPLIGVTEDNANLLYAPGSVSLPSAFQTADLALSALRPTYVRLLVDWAKFQLQPGQPATLAGTVDGCSRGQGPCLPYLWLKAELEAIKTRQAAGANVQPVLDVYGTPAWAAQAQTGCDPPLTTAVSAPLSKAGLLSYQQLIRDILALGQQVGVALPYWAPWNEPNTAPFLTPQRAACRTSSPSLSPGEYARLVKAMQATLNPSGAAPGSHQLLLGELAAVPGSSPNGTSIPEFVAALPKDVVCSSKIWAIHDYAVWGAYQDRAPVKALEAALRLRGCNATIWVTETGAGGPRPGGPRSATVAGEVAACQSMDAKLQSYLRDPRVTAAFQYSFRDDKAYPIGLENAQLTQLYPTYSLWLAWSQRDTSAAPTLPMTCV